MPLTSITIPARFDFNPCTVQSQFLPGLILVPAQFDLSSCQVRSLFLPGSISFLPGSFYFLSGSISAPVRFDLNSCQVRSQFLPYTKLRSQFLSSSVSIPALNPTTISIQLTGAHERGQSQLQKTIKLSVENPNVRSQFLPVYYKNQSKLLPPNNRHFRYQLLPICP